MSSRLAIGGLLGVALLGCGTDGVDDGDDPAPQVQTGFLHAGGIQGVAYVTPSRSGLTDANGRFEYESGEIVSFFVGNIGLGSAPGTGEITVFRLAGATPPNTELALRRELVRMQTAATPLARASNIATLLIALDADGNPDNGLDVRNRAATLRHGVDFNQVPYEFAEDLGNLAPGMYHNIPLGRSLVHLYRSLNLRVSGGVIARQFWDNDLDGDDDYVATATFDANAQPTRLDTDFGLDGSVDFTQFYAHDALGRDLGWWAESYNGGVVTETNRTTKTYDAHGNQLSYLSVEGTFPGLGWEYSWTATYDAYGLVLSGTTRSSFGGGPLTNTDTTTYARDASGNALTELFEYDGDGDGNVDMVRRTTNEFDAAGRLVASTADEDNGNDGFIEVRTSSQWTRDGRGRVVRQVVENDTSADGVIEYRMTSEFTFDAAGNRTRLVQDTVDDLWLTTIRDEIVYEYGTDNRPVGIIETIDYDVDGVFENLRTEEWTYDAHGFVTRRDSYYGDADMDFPQYVGSATTTYNAQGAPLTEIATTDFGGDGIPDYANGIRYEYAASDDATARIIGNYLPL